MATSLDFFFSFQSRSSAFSKAGFTFFPALLCDSDDQVLVAQQVNTGVHIQDGFVKFIDPQCHHVRYIRTMNGIESIDTNPVISWSWLCKRHSRNTEDQCRPQEGRRSEHTHPLGPTPLHFLFPFLHRLNASFSDESLPPGAPGRATLTRKKMRSMRISGSQRFQDGVEGDRMGNMEEEFPRPIRENPVREALFLFAVTSFAMRFSTRFPLYTV